MRASASYALVSDAHVVAYRRVELRDGSGRGSAADWLAAGCWPDASQGSPALAVLGRDVFFADGSRTVRLPSTDGWPSATRRRGVLWPEAWATCEDGETMLRAAHFLPDAVLVSAAVECARASIAGAGLVALEDRRPHQAVEAAAAWLAGGRTRPLARAAKRALAAVVGSYSNAETLRGAHAAGAAGRAASSAAHADTRATDVAAAADHAAYAVASRRAAGRAAVADIVRSVAPWHVVLDALVARGQTF